MGAYEWIRQNKTRFVSVPMQGTVENPAVDTVAEHLDVYHVLAPTLSPAEKRDHARRIVDAVLAMNGAKVIR